MSAYPCSKLFQICNPQGHVTCWQVKWFRSCPRSSICRYDDGCTGITNIDFSKGVIKEMMLKNLRKRPLMKWQVMDMTQTKASIPSGTPLQLAPAPHTTPCVYLLGDRQGNSACFPALHPAGALAQCLDGSQAEAPGMSCHGKHSHVLYSDQPGSQNQASVKQYVAGDTSRLSCMQFADGSFSAVVDKGGLDALMGEDTEGADAAGGELLAEVARLLEPRRGSLYLCVTLAQSHVLSAPHLISTPESVYTIAPRLSHAEGAGILSWSLPSQLTQRVCYTCRQALATSAELPRAEMEQLFPALLLAGSFASSCACREAPGSLHWTVACESAAPTTYSRYGRRCAAACPSQRPEG
jgi:hypothetical protein